MIFRSEDCYERGSTTPGAHGDILIHEFTPKSELEFGQCTLFCTIKIGPGGGIPYHPHMEEMEYYSIIQGIATYTQDDVVYTLKAGDTAKCNYGSSHGIENKSDEDVLLVALMFKREK